MYDLEAEHLKLRLMLYRLRPTSWHIYRVDPGNAEQSQLVYDLSNSLHLPETTVHLTEAHKKDLKEGKYVVAVRSAELPDGILRGQLIANVKIN